MPAEQPHEPTTGEEPAGSNEVTHPHEPLPTDAAQPDEPAGVVPAADEQVESAVGAGTAGPVEERVRQQVARLDGIEALPPAEHAQRYDEVHAELQAALTEIDGEGGG